MANYHLVILKKPYLEAILAGDKQIESRFMNTKGSVFGRVLSGDILFLKLSSGPVCATARAAAVKTFENLKPKQIFKLKKQYNHLICGSEKYWRSKTNCKFGFLVRLERVRRIEAVRIDKKDWRGWVVLTEDENFGLLKMKATKKGR